MRTSCRWVTALALGICAHASAQSFPIREYSVEQLHLDPAAVDSLVTGSGRLLDPGELRIRAAAHYEREPLIFDIQGVREIPVIQERLSVHLLAAYAPVRWLELGVSALAIPYQSGEGVPSIGVPDVSGSGIGAPSLHGKTALLRQEGDRGVNLSLGLDVDLPFGTSAALATASTTVFTPELTLSRRFGHLAAVVSAGSRLRRSSVVGNDVHGSSASTGAALVYAFERASLEVNTFLDIPYAKSPVAWEALAGGRIHFGLLDVFALAGPGLSRAAGTPAYRVLVGLGFSPSLASKPAVAVAAPPPPKPTPPPSPCENGAAHRPEQCPKLDDDADGITNAEDLCPLVAGIAAEKGCPFLDQDKDTVADRLDECPKEAGLPELKGCPAKDQDADSVADAEDNCPTVKGPVENHGCPQEQKQMVVLTRQRLIILEKVHFATGSARILPSSNLLLHQVAGILNSHPDIHRTEIEGHTDNSGGEAFNRKLSQSRAESVMKALTDMGVESNRLSASGFGPERPVADNASAEGREENRRVEFRIVEAAPEQPDAKPAPSSNSEVQP